jgi:hypothetical protein
MTWRPPLPRAGSDDRDSESELVRRPGRAGVAAHGLMKTCYNILYRYWHDTMQDDNLAYSMCLDASKSDSNPGDLGIHT